MPTASGFRHAPVSKGLLIATAGASVLTQAARASRRPMPAALHLASRAVVFRSPAELLFGALLMYYFRVLERESGSAKFGAFACLTTGVAGALQWAATRAGLPALTAAGAVPSGPYGFIFACLVQYFVQIPPSSKMYVFGWKLTDKVFVYLLGLQLLLPGGAGSVVAGASGLLAGVLYAANAFGVKRLRLPGFITRFFGSTLGPLLDGDPLPPAPAMGAAGAPGRGAVRPGGQAGAAGSGARGRSGGAAAAAAGAGGGGGGAGVAGAGAGAAAGLPPASPELIEQLVAMGFSASEAARALQLANNDVQQAIGLLL